MHVIQYATSNTDTVSNSKWYKKKKNDMRNMNYASSPQTRPGI